MEIHTRLENGKAYLQFAFSEADSDISEAEMVLLQVRDKEHRAVLNCAYPLSEDEPAEGILLHPHLWKGVEEPYLYTLVVYAVEVESESGGSRLVEKVHQSFALCTLEEITGKGLFLNGKPFEVRAVCWDGHNQRQEEGLVPIGHMLENLRTMGANTIYLREEPTDAMKELLQLCGEKGFLVLVKEPKLLGSLKKQSMGGVVYCINAFESLEYELAEDRIPAYSRLFSYKYPFHTDLYYHYRAGWSKEPFVHICLSSIKKQENGSFSLRVYSNQKKIALYVNGMLFEFLTGIGEYFFEEILIKKYPAVLTAEAGECNTAVTIYGRSQNVHKFFTF